MRMREVQVLSRPWKWFSSGLRCRLKVQVDVIGESLYRYPLPIQLYLDGLAEGSSEINNPLLHECNHVFLETSHVKFGKIWPKGHLCPVFPFLALGN